MQDCKKSSLPNKELKLLKETRRRGCRLLKKHWSLCLSFVTLLLLFMPSPTQAFTDGSGWVQVTYLNKILMENHIRFKQLQSMIRNAKNEAQYLRMINDGVQGVTGLMQMLPIQDNRVLGEIRNFQEALHLVRDVYGIIPKSKDAPLHRLNDESVAESIKMANKSKSYARKQEENAVKVFHAGGKASPKGAVRMTAQANAQILHSLNQLIKINAQILQLVSTHVAYQNKGGKQSVKNFKKVGLDMKKGFANFKGDFKMPKFDK